MIRVHKPTTGDIIVLRYPEPGELSGFGLQEFWDALMTKDDETSLGDMLLALKREGKAHRGDYSGLYLGPLAMSGLIAIMR